MGEAQRRCGRPEYRETLLAAAADADAAGDVELLTLAVLHNTRGFVSRVGHVDLERLDRIERALRRTSTADHGRRALLLGRLAHESRYDGTLDIAALFDEMVAEARRSGDRLVLIATL